MSVDWTRGVNEKMDAGVHRGGCTGLGLEGSKTFSYSLLTENLICNR